MYTYPLNYDNLRDYISKGRDKVSRPLAHNTTVRTDFTNVIVKYHNTDIVTFQLDGGIVLNTGGWLTSTTKARLSELLPSGWNVYQRRGVWYLWRYETGEEWVYADGMIVYPADGRVIGYGVDPKADLKQRSKIRAYSKKYMAALLAGKVHPPSGGDCWYCVMHTESGESLGESLKDTSHLDSHFEESYFVPSLIQNAIKQFPVSRMANYALYSIWYDPANDFTSARPFLKEQGTKSLVKYLYAQYGLAR